MNNYEFLNDLFTKSAAALGCSFIKTTASRVESYANKTAGPFFALIKLEESKSRGVESSLVSFDCSLIFIRETALDPTDEELNKALGESSDLCNRFANMADKSPSVEILSLSLSELFRSGGYAGLGKAFTFTLSMADRTNYCIDKDDNRTRDLSCG